MPGTIINNAKSKDLVTFDLKVNKKLVPQTIQVHSIDIWKELNRIPRAKIVILDGDPAAETFAVSEQEWFEPGKEIQIFVGYHSDNALIFSGIITSQAIKVRTHGNNLLTLECRNKAIKMTAVPRSHYFYGMKESEVFKNIIQKYKGVEEDVGDIEFVHQELLQFQATDWDFMLSRVDVNGMFCHVNGEKISIKKPDFSGDPVEKISFGKNLLEIDAEMDATTQVSGVRGTSWDYSATENSEIGAQSLSSGLREISNSEDLPQKEKEKEKKKVKDPNTEWLLQSSGKVPMEVLQSWVNSKLMKHELAKVRGRARIRGVTIQPEDIVEFEGVGARFNGKAFVSGVRHSVGGGEWITDIQYGLSPKWFSEQYDISSKPASGMLPAINGLQIGLVTKVEGDPDGDERILVRMPIIAEDEQGIWARIATTGAGSDRGLVFRPEVGDEVIIGFIGEDPNQPVILGSVHSSNKPSPIKAEEGNNQKGWLTRGGVKMLINDEKPSLEIEMPSGRKLLLDDDSGETVYEDGEGNKISCNAEGISLESSKDLILKASGNVVIEAGMNLNAEAVAGLTAKGGSAAEVSSSGSTTVKGSIVQIN